MEFEEVFSIKNLDDYQLGHLSFILNSPSYSDIFLPYLKGVRNSLNVKMLDRSQVRKDLYNDDFLAGGIIAIDGLIALFSKLLDETNMDKLAEAQAMTPEQQYDSLRAAGKISAGGGGLTVPTEVPYDPSTDY